MKTPIAWGILSVVVHLALAASPALAQYGVNFWETQGGGDWFDAENWSQEEVPNTSQWVKFRSGLTVFGASRHLSVVVDIDGHANAGLMEVEASGDILGAFDVTAVFAGASRNSSVLNVGNLNVKSDTLSVSSNSDAVASFNNLRVETDWLKVTSEAEAALRHTTSLATLSSSNLVASSGFQVSGIGAELTINNSLVNVSDPSKTSTVSDRGILRTRSNSALNINNLRIDETGEWIVEEDISYSGYLEGAGQVTIKNPSVLTLSGSQSDTIALDFAGEGGLRVSNGTKTLSGGNSFTGGLFLDGGVTQVSRGGNTGGLANTIHFNGGELRFTLANNFHTDQWNVMSDSVISTPFDVEAYIHGDFTGSATLQKQDTGKLLLQGDNSAFTGTFLVSEGSLWAGINDSLGDQTQVIVESGASFQLQGHENWGSLSGDGAVFLNGYNAKLYEAGSQTLGGSLRGSGTLTMAGSGELRFDTNALIQNFAGDMAVTNGTLELNGFSIGRFDGTMTTSGEGTAEYNTRSANFTLDGGIINNGRMLKTGSGTLSLVNMPSGSSGVVEVAQGTLAVNGRLPGDTLHLSGGKVVAATGIFVDNLIVESSGELDTGSNNVAIRDDLSGNGHLVKSGEGEITLYSSANLDDFTGQMDIRAGNVEFRKNMAQGRLMIGANGTATVQRGSVDFGSLEGAGMLQLVDVDDGGGVRTARIGLDNSSTTFSGIVQGAGVFRKAGTGTLTIAGDIANSDVFVEQGTLSFASNSPKTFTRGIDVAEGSELQINQAFDLAGSLTGQGHVRLADGSDSVTFRGNNETFAGLVTIGNGRTLNVGRSGSLGRETSVAIALDGLVQLEGAEYWGGLSGSGSLDLRNFEARIGQGNQSSQFLGSIAGTANFSKIGLGEFSFDGDATNLLGTFFASSGTLAGNGAFNDLVIQDGATLSIGNSAGLVTIDSLELSQGSLLNIELGGLALDEFDRMVVSGDATVAGDLAVSLIDGFTLANGQEFLIADIGGQLLGQFNGLQEGSLVTTFAGQNLFLTYQAGDGNDIGLFTAVPEPNAVLLLLLGAVWLVSRRPRQPGMAV